MKTYSANNMILTFTDKKTGITTFLKYDSVNDSWEEERIEPAPQMPNCRCVAIPITFIKSSTKIMTVKPKRFKKRKKYKWYR